MRISVKLLAISEIVLLVAVLVLSVPILVKMHEQVVEDMKNTLRAIAGTAALQIDGDLHRRLSEMAEAETADDRTNAEESTEFASLRRTLTAVRDQNDLNEKHIYTFYRDGDHVRFAVMTHPKPFVGDSYKLREGMLDVFVDGKLHTTDVYTDDFGEWVSVYAPITDSEGTVVGLLEVDLPADAYFARLSFITRLTVLMGIIALLISSLLGWRVLNRLVIRPMKLIRGGVTALGEQDFNHRVELRTGDEFQDLGETLNGISQQLDVASMIQASFFPNRMPDVPGYRVAGLSVPCDATGGDYYDAFELEGGRIAVLIADVSGHGLGASLLMATCRAAVRALSGAALGPGALLDRLNTLLRDDLEEGRFVTMVYGVFEPNGAFTYANAGHGPALVLRAGVITHLESHRPPLGIDLDLDLGPGIELDVPETRLDLAPGDRLLLTSDGLSEAFDADGRFFGVAPIERAAAEAAITCDVVVTRLRDEMLAHCGGPSQTDDVTILCVDRT